MARVLGWFSDGLGVVSEWRVKVMAQAGHYDMQLCKDGRLAVDLVVSVWKMEDG